MASAPAYKAGIVKQILSGDTLLIRKEVGCPPPEKTVVLSGIVAPKLARQRTPNSDLETKDEPFAWEAREFLRKLLIGKEVVFTSDKPPNAGRVEYGTVWAGKDPTKDENVAELLLAEGFVKMRDNAKNIPQLKQYVDIEEAAKNQGKGVWGKDAQKHIRDVKWNVDNPKQFVANKGGQPVKAIIEYVRDGSTVRLCLLPDFYQITFMLSGMRCPAVKPDASEPFADEARYFVESRLLQRDIEVVLETVNNTSFVGTILHPNGNIAEVLLKQGFGKCVDWSLAVMKNGAQALRAAEKVAKEAKRRIWTNYQSNAPQIAAKDKEFQGVVIEVVNGDAIVVKDTAGNLRKVFLSSVRPPPREKAGAAPAPAGKQAANAKGLKPLYDTPWMFEAREYLRKKLVGKKVHVIVDYIQPAKENLPEKKCCTILVGTTNVAEGLVAKGLATVVRYRNDNDQRSCHYDKLLEEEVKALKAAVGVHAKKGIPTHRIQDTSGDSAKARKFFPFLKRSQKMEAVVEFVAGGSRMKLYIPKESVLVTFLLAGITCPRTARPGGGLPEPFGEEALQFTKEKCLQRDVTVSIVDMDKAGNFIGWMWVESDNMSVALVERGLAAKHHTADVSEYAKAIKTAEDNAMKDRKGIWKDYIEKEVEKDKPKETTVQDRNIKHEMVIISEVTPDGKFYVQRAETIDKVHQLTEKLCQEIEKVPYSPTRGTICAAHYKKNGCWYRAKVEKVEKDGEYSVFYIDYGNREVVRGNFVAPLPPGFTEPPYAMECTLACVKFPSDPEDRTDAIQCLLWDIMDKKLLMNVEIKGSPAAITLINPRTNEDMGKGLIAEGMALVDPVRDRRLSGLIAEYKAAQEYAKTTRLNLWRHGDITEDDAVEFGVRR